MAVPAAVPEMGARKNPRYIVLRASLKPAASPTNRFAFSQSAVPGLAPQISSRMRP